jgi:capsular exopolysaccharide synthesis family protein
MLSSDNSPVLSNNEPSFQHEETPISINNIFHSFWIHRYLFIVIVIAVGVIGLFLVSRLVPRYTSETKVLIGVPISQVIDVKSVLSGDMNSEFAIKSESETILSRELAKKVITKLNLLSVPEFNPNSKRSEKGAFSALNPKNWLPDSIKSKLGLEENETVISDEEKQARVMLAATEIYLGKLKVNPVKGSQIVSIGFESLSAKLAAKIANAHADSYIIGQLQVKFEATEKANAWLNMQLTDLRAKVVNSEKAVESYRAEHGLVSGSNKEAGLVGEQLSEINNQLVTAKVQKAEATARLEQVTKLRSSGADIETASEVLSSPLIQSLREQETELTRKLSEISADLGENHPKIISTNAELAGIRAKIKEEISKIVAGLDNELNIASTRVTNLQNSLAASQRIADQHGKEEVQLRALEREANANKLLFETFLNRFKETTSTQGTEQADARVISVAEIADIPSFPKKKVLLMIVIVMAFGSASAAVFLLEFLRAGLRSPEEVEKHLGFVALGLMPKITQKVAAYDYLLDKPDSSLAATINSLRISLMLSSPDKPVSSLIITSTLPNEGKTTLALSLARSAAIAGQKVMIIDADFKQSSLTKQLGITNHAKGLTDLILSPDATLSDYMIKDGKTSLMIMPKGCAEYLNSADVFATPHMNSLLIRLCAEFDLIIFDTPPVLAVTDARVLAALVDKVVYVVAWDKTPKNIVKIGLDELLKSVSHIAGIVLQQVDLQQYTYSSGDSGFYYYYSKYRERYSD